MPVELTRRSIRGGGRAAGPVALAASLFLSGCVVAPPVRTVAVPVPRPQRLFVYPAQGQSPDQLARDRYECHIWAVQQTGFDPSRANVPTYEQVVVQPAPGAGTVAGAVSGAIIGSILAGPRDSGVGALFGGATGAILGSAADADARQQARQAHQFNRQAAEGRSGSQNYRRAITACLDARGYSVN